MLFEEVPYDRLIPGQKYKITKMSALYYDGRFEGYCHELQNLVSIQFRDVKYYLPHIIHIKSQSFFKSASFYRPISKKMAQESMERRAVNKVIQRIVGQYFDWYL
jgi:hypothetical protein